MRYRKAARRGAARGGGGGVSRERSRCQSYGRRKDFYSRNLSRRALEFIIAGGAAALSTTTAPFRYRFRRPAFLAARDDKKSALGY